MQLAAVWTVLEDAVLAIGAQVAALQEEGLGAVGARYWARLVPLSLDLCAEVQLQGGRVARQVVAGARGWVRDPEAVALVALACTLANFAVLVAVVGGRRDEGERPPNADGEKSAGPIAAVDATVRAVVQEPPPEAPPEPPPEEDTERVRRYDCEIAARQRRLCVPLARWVNAVEVKGPVFLVSAQFGADDWGVLLPTAEQQCAAAFKNLERALHDGGRTVLDVAKLTVYLVQGRCGLSQYRQELERFFPRGAIPAVTIIFVTALATENIFVQIEAIAA